MATAKIPITNYIYGAPVGDYVAQIQLGASQVTAYVILDTGSSTLAVWQDKFQGVQTTPTNFIQYVGYGTGHWAGPVLQAQVELGTGDNIIGLSNALIAQIQSGIYRGQRQFHPADGILGIAYFTLNSAAEVSSLPFPVSQYDTGAKWAQLTDPQSPNALPVKYLPPFFTELVDAGATPNKFAFLTRRSIVHDGPDPATDPLNQGWFVLGGGEEHTELYTGEFQSVKEIDDPNGLGRYYNSNLLQVQVGDSAPIQVPPPSADSGQLSNSIIDSGTNSLALAQPLLAQIEPSFQGLSRPSSESDLASWPSLYFTLEGSDGGEVRLEVKPEQYWQLDSLAPGGTSTVTGNFFNISPTPVPQSILGLPLMNDYYVVFDRSATDPPTAGEIKFAQASPDA